MNITHEMLAKLRLKMRAGSHFIIGGRGADTVYVGVRHADGTEEFATEEMATTVKSIDASASLPVHQR